MKWQKAILFTLLAVGAGWVPHTAQAASLRIPSHVYPPGAHIGYRPVLTNGEVDCMCTQWSVVSNPDVSEAPSALDGVTAKSSNDAWTVGLSLNGGWNSLIEHWNGSSWSVVNLTGVSAGTQLNSVTGLSANDVWAVGVTPANFPYAQPLIVHWDGLSWSVINGPSLPPNISNSLSSVSGTSSTDVWAAGPMRASTR
jgi:hypothetical protein